MMEAVCTETMQSMEAIGRRAGLKIIFVRHGKTKGNTEGRYVGRTDEPLWPETAAELETIQIPQAELVIASPMLRCRQTAALLYPGKRAYVQEGLQEMDFGAFEYRNYQELSGNPDYQAYIDSGGQIGFPKGERLEAFRNRCCQAFLNAMDYIGEQKASSAAFVVHGGTIMAVLEAFGQPKRSYFDWQIKNGAWLEGVVTKDGKIAVQTDL